MIISCTLWCKCCVSVMMRKLHSSIQMYYFWLSSLWFKGCTSWTDAAIPGSGLCLCEVLWQQSTTQEVQNRAECHNGTFTDNQEDTQTRLPNPQQRERNSHENKGTRLFFCFLFWESCPGSSPSQQSWELLVQDFPHHHGYNNTRPIRLTGPVTPRHAKTHRIRPQTGWACTQAHLP